MPLKSKFTATNSIEPAKIVKLIKRGYQKLNPDVFIYIPYVIPKNQNPAKMGMVYGNAAFNAFTYLFFICKTSLFVGFVIQHTMTETFKIRVGNLLFKLLAYAFVFGLVFKPAGTITVSAFKPLFNRFNNFFVGVKCNFHS